MEQQNVYRHGVLTVGRMKTTGTTGTPMMGRAGSG